MCAGNSLEGGESKMHKTEDIKCGTVEAKTKRMVWESY